MGEEEYFSPMKSRRDNTTASTQRIQVTLTSPKSGSRQKSGSFATGMSTKKLNSQSRLFPAHNEIINKAKKDRENKNSKEIIKEKRPKSREIKESREKNVERDIFSYRDPINYTMKQLRTLKEDREATSNSNRDIMTKKSSKKTLGLDSLRTLNQDQHKRERDSVDNEFTDTNANHVQVDSNAIVNADGDKEGQLLFDNDLGTISQMSSQKDSEMHFNNESDKKNDEIDLI